MTLKRVNTALATLLGLFIIFIGARFLIDPLGAAAGFGIPEWPHGTAAGYFDIKGVRDITSGLIIFAVLVTGHRRALGWVLLAETFTPLGDAVTVLSHHGPASIAFGVHAATAAIVALAGALLLRETAPAAAVTPSTTAQAPALR